MRVAVIGSGSLGKALAMGLKKAGHSVELGASATVSERFAADLITAGLPIRAAVEAAHAADVLVVATPWSTTEATLRSLGNAARKILLDATNPLDSEQTELALGDDCSGAECIARWVPGARVVKIFNTATGRDIANPFFITPDYGTELATMFYCGDDVGAKQAARVLAYALGFDPVDAGPLSCARLLEPLAMLKIQIARQGKYGPDIAFRLLRR